MTSPQQSPQPQSAGSLTFVGTATILLNLGPFTLLTDPNFLARGQRAYLGRGLWSRRLTNPAMRVEELPDLDAVVLSHLHGDHWDRVARAGLSRDVPLVTTTHASRRLRRSGFPTVGLETWQEEVLRKHGHELTVTSLPAIHGRGVMGALLPPVMGSMVEHRIDERLVQRVYLSGDTLTGDHLDAITERFSPIDVAVVHLGGTRILAATVTMDGEQGVDFVQRIAPDRVVPVHYDDYRVFRSPLSDFLGRASAAGLSRCITAIQRGETIELPERRTG